MGSAWGPGGLAARVGRHLRGSDRRHWHIDHLRASAQPAALWLAPGLRAECAWAQHLLARGGRVIAPGFGASDCACETHLAFLDAIPFAAMAFPVTAPQGGERVVVAHRIASFKANGPIG